MLQQNQTIKCWAEDDRPREKLILKGRTNLSDSELIAILIQNGTKEKSALDLAKDLLANSQNSLLEFSQKSVNELCKIKGIGPAKAVTIIAALELGRRRKEAELNKKVKIVKSEIAYELIRFYLEDLKHEEFYVMYLNKANILLHTKRISIGGVTGTVVDNRILFKEAIECLATGIILVHNHPSGQLRPSEQDIKLTKKIQQIGELMEIVVMDHIIVTPEYYYSFADNGLL
ncbi:MAG: RadC family protein [Flavobacteriia bacterium]|jgi:DNA repair protein RadC